MTGTVGLSADASKLSRQETKERHALTRQLRKSLRERARGTGWGCARGCLFRNHQDWFVEVMPIVALNGLRTHLRLHIKPMALDPIFWQIAELPENVRLPLSFRASGAWTCHTYPVVETILPDAEHQAETLATLVLDWADEQLKQRGAHWTLQDFIDRLQHANNGWSFASLVTALALAGRSDEAISTCLEAKTRGGMGGFMVASRGSFVDLALAYLRSINPSHAADTLA